MRLLAGVVLGVVLATSPAWSASEVVRITRDTGGQIGPYLAALTAIRDSGQQVIIDGLCLSACTLVLGVIPRERLCATRRARLGFHVAWHHGEDGRAITNHGGTQLLMENYPQNVRNWINQRGGLTQEIKYLTGRELAAMVPTCR
jgi:hypothetical protein